MQFDERDREKKKWIMQNWKEETETEQNYLTRRIKSKIKKKIGKTDGEWKHQQKKKKEEEKEKRQRLKKWIAEKSE